MGSPKTVLVQETPSVKVSVNQVSFAPYRTGTVPLKLQNPFSLAQVVQVPRGVAVGVGESVGVGEAVGVDVAVGVEEAVGVSVAD